MRLKIITAGSKMPAWVEQGYQHYAKRLPKNILPSLVQVPLGPRSKNIPIQKAIDKEGELILSEVVDSDQVIVLDVKGKPWSTGQLANNLSRWCLEGVDYSFLIGGPDGLAMACLERAQLHWSLSPLTLPHPLVRIIVIEQLYRAWTIMNNHPYHK